MTVSTAGEGCEHTGADVALADDVEQVELAEVATWDPDLLAAVDVWLKSVSGQAYYHWSSRNDSLSNPYNACSPSLSQIFAYFQATQGARSLGCHNQRTVSGSSTLSSHAWGAAADIGFPSRQMTIDMMGWLITWSAELGINTIHDYVTQRMWKPLIGWQSASIGSVGGTWIHVETTPGAFSDTRPIEDRLAGGIQEPPGGLIVTPEDKGYLESKFAAVAPSTADPSTEGWPTFQTSQAIGDIRVFAQRNAEALARLEARLDAQESVAAQILAAIQGASFPISGTAHIGTT